MSYYLLALGSQICQTKQCKTSCRKQGKDSLPGAIPDKYIYSITLPSLYHPYQDNHRDIELHRGRVCISFTWILSPLLHHLSDISALEGRFLPSSRTKEPDQHVTSGTDSNNAGAAMSDLITVLKNVLHAIITPHNGSLTTSLERKKFNWDATDQAEKFALWRDSWLFVQAESFL